MKRGWFVERDQASEYGEGTDAARAKALCLAEIADADFIDSILRAKAALDTFGGKIFIGADRHKYDREGNVVDHNEVGQYATSAYVCHFDHEPMKGVEAEPDLSYLDVQSLYRSQVLQPVASENGAEPEPVPAEG